MLYIIVQIRVYKANFIEIIIYRSKGHIQKYINDKVDKFLPFRHYILLSITIIIIIILFYILTRKFI